MIHCCLLLVTFHLFVHSYAVHVKSVHAIMRDKMMCIETTRMMLDQDHMAVIENINVTLSLLSPSRNQRMDVILGKTDKCLSKARFSSTKTTDTYFFCGKYQDPIQLKNNNLEMYKNFKVTNIQGNIDVSMVNDTGHSITVMIKDFDIKERIRVSIHLHGYDPCRFVSKSIDVCDTCISICQLYATGYGMFRCNDKLKTYNKDVRDMMEVSHSPFQLNAEKIHVEKERNIFCVQATTDIKSMCYAEFTKQSLQLYSPRTKDVKTFNTSPKCKSLFYTSGYPGTFCFVGNGMHTKELITYFPKSLQLYNLTMYCDDFSLVANYIEINIFGIDVQKYKKMMIYDVCPRSVHDKGQPNKEKSFELKNGLLVEEHVENPGNHSMIALIVVCVFIFLLIVSLLLFFVFHVRKSCL